MSANPLAKLDKARQYLAECKTLPEVKKIRAIAEAARIYAKAAHLGRKTVNYASEIKLLADHKAGRLLEQLKRDDKREAGEKKARSTVKRASEYARILKETNTSKVTAHRWREIGGIPEEKLADYVALANDAEETDITAKGLLGFVSAESGTAQVSSDSNEYYTLPEHIEAARIVLGGIDLDPASHPTANETVKAAKFYTIANDGLSQSWAGRVWLNPPWGSVGPEFVSKLVESYRAGQVSAAILLINSHATDTQWFQPLWDFTLCFTSPRIKYWQPEGGGKSPTGGSVFVYFGDDRAAFFDVFSKYGAIVERVDRESL